MLFCIIFPKDISRTVCSKYSSSSLAFSRPPLSCRTLAVSVASAREVTYLFLPLSYGAVVAFVKHIRPDIDAERGEYCFGMLLRYSTHS